MRTRSLSVGAIAALAVMTALAQAGPVYIGERETGYVWSFPDTSGVPLNGESPFIGVVGLALRADGQILVADRGGAVVAVLDPDSGLFSVVDTTAAGIDDLYPDCASEDVYYITSRRVEDFTLHVLPGGLAPAYDCISFSAPPLDLQVYPSGDRAGHVIVLTDTWGEVGPRLAEYERTGETAFVELPPIIGDVPGSPRSFAIRPNGALVLLDGSAGLFDVGPDGGLTHFGPTSGVYGDKIDIGADGIIYVTDPEMGITRRFDPDGDSINPSLSTGEVPSAVAAVGFTPTPPGPNVPVNPTDGVEMLFEGVAGGGYTSASMAISDSRVSPRGDTLPDYAVPPVGRSTFTYVSLATSAVFENLVQVDVLLPGTRLFFAHGPGEVFHDVTIEGSAEDARGTISRFSEVVVVDDTRTAGEVVGDKFGKLMEILQSPPDDPPELAAARAHLRQHAQRALDFVDDGKALLAITELWQMNNDIRGWAGTVIPNISDGPGGNLAGEMLSRSKTLMFSLWFLVPPSGVPGDGSPGTDLSLSCASPARGECAFELAGPVGARVAVKLYDVSGRLVRTLFDGLLTTGSRALVWDGTDDDGRAVASGVYLSRAGSGDACATGKVVFIR